jgi:RNA polymerase sigma-70 factor (ECF subfamily)
VSPDRPSVLPDGAAPSEPLPAAESIDTLLCRVGRGDLVAVADLYEQTSTTVFRTVRRVIGDFSRSEEVTQEVYAQLWQSAAQRFDPTRGQGWAFLLAVARRRAIDQLRSLESSRRHDTTMSRATTYAAAGDVADATVARLQLLLALRGVGEQARRILALYYYLDHSYGEISTLLAMPIGTVKSHHHRALIALRRSFES